VQTLSVVFHGYIRTTGDMDLWVRPDNDNKQKLIKVIEHFDIPFLGYEDFIINKLSTGRLKDQADVEELKKIHRIN
jgi:hypothetical protein